MAVKLRLRRIGKRNRPYYRICAIDARKARGGEYIESIGNYDPHVADDAKKVQLDKERAEYWIGVGAQPSETVASFLRREQVAGLSRPKKKVKRRRKKAPPKPPAGAAKPKARKPRTKKKKTANKEA